MTTGARRGEDRQANAERKDDHVELLHSLIEARRKLDAVLRQSVSFGSQRAT